MNSIEQCVDMVLREHRARNADAAVMQEYRNDLLLRVRERVNAEMSALLPESAQSDYRDLLDVDAEPESLQEFFMMHIPTYQTVLEKTLAEFRETQRPAEVPHSAPHREKRHDDGVEAQARYARRHGESVELAHDGGEFESWSVGDVIHGTTEHAVQFHGANGQLLTLPAHEAERREDVAERMKGHGVPVRVVSLAISA